MGPGGCLAKKSRSPGCRWFRGTLVPDCHWVLVWPPMLALAFAQAYSVRPEQSKPMVLAPRPMPRDWILTPLPPQE